jgi:putative cardiolipin synthase
VKNTPRTASFAPPASQSSALVRDYHSQTLSQNGKSGFVLLGTGLDAFAARTALFRKAQKTIDVQYFLVRNDLTGWLFYESVIDAADRGVKVRVLFDDHHLLGKATYLLELNQHPNIEIRLFNPLSRRTPRVLQYVFRLGHITRRMHNKAVIVDGAVTIFGSRNIGNEYFDAKSSMVNSDMDAVAVGPIVKSFSTLFDEFWNYRRSVEISNILRPKRRHEALKKRSSINDPTAQQYKQALLTSPLVNQINTGKLPLRWGKAVLVKDQPEKVDTPRPPRGSFLNSTDLKPFIEQVKDNAFFVTPYFIPGQEGIQFFKKLISRGVSVSVLTNSFTSTDSEIVNAHYSNYRKALIKAGVKLYELKATRGSLSFLERMRSFPVSPSKAVLHAKMITFDDKQLYIGSLNMDPRSLYENTEVGVLISSEDMTKEVHSWLVDNLDEMAYRVELENGRVVWRDSYKELERVQRKEPDTTKFQRLLLRVMSVLPIESQL